MNETQCKQILDDGKRCPNLVDDGQVYCPYHLGKKASKWRTVKDIAGAALGLTLAVVMVILGRGGKKGR